MIIFIFGKKAMTLPNRIFSFKLEQIILKDVDVSYVNKKAKQNIALTINKCKLSGDFSNEKYTLETENDIYVNRLKFDNTNYISKKNIHSELALEVDNQTKSYKIKEGLFKIENLAFEIYGNIISANQTQVLNLGIKEKTWISNRYYRLFRKNTKRR